MSGLAQLQKEVWFQTLQTQCEKTSISDVARKLDYARPTVSLVLSGNYDGGTDKFAAKVIATFTDRVRCPHFGCEIIKGDCNSHQSRPMPTSDPAALKLWISCRSGCPNSFHQMEDVDNA